MTSFPVHLPATQRARNHALRKTCVSNGLSYEMTSCCFPTFLAIQTSRWKSVLNHCQNENAFWPILTDNRSCTSASDATIKSICNYIKSYYWANWHWKQHNENYRNPLNKPCRHTIFRSIQSAATAKMWNYCFSTGSVNSAWKQLLPRRARNRANCRSSKEFPVNKLSR